jgi:hypothetical protein
MNKKISVPAWLVAVLAIGTTFNIALHLFGSPQGIQIHPPAFADHSSEPMEQISHHTSTQSESSNAQLSIASYPNRTYSQAVWVGGQNGSIIRQWQIQQDSRIYFMHEYTVDSENGTFTERTLAKKK